MNRNVFNSDVSGNQSHDAEETLRLVATLPAPEGLTDRVHARVKDGRLNLAGEPGRRAFWSFWAPAQRLQFAGAALLVVAVAGSTWSVYHGRAAGQVARPAVQTPAAGSFGSAGAVRVPPTLAPILVPPRMPPVAHRKPNAGHAKPVRKPVAEADPAAAQK